MSTIKNFTMNQYNGIDYDILYPKSTSQQVLLNDSELASQLGLSGENPTVNDGLSVVGGLKDKFKLYKWLKITNSYNISVGDVEDVVFATGSYPTMSYCESLLVSPNGYTFALINAKSVAGSSVSTFQNALPGHYFRKESGSFLFYFVPSDATVYKSGSGSSTQWHVSAQLVSLGSASTNIENIFTTVSTTYSQGLQQSFSHTIAINEYIYLVGTLSNFASVSCGEYIGLGTDSFTLDLGTFPKLLLMVWDTYTGSSTNPNVTYCCLVGGGITSCMSYTSASSPATFTWNGTQATITPGSNSNINSLATLGRWYAFN